MLLGLCRRLIDDQVGQNEGWWIPLPDPVDHPELGPKEVGDSLGTVFP